MPITVVGRVSKFNGKSVFQLVSNIKDFGVGRIVYRCAFQRYQEPTYWRLTRVEPEMDKERKLGSVWAETIWRGKSYGVHQMLSPYKADYRLVPKDEEEQFCSRKFEPLNEKILPSHAPLPPLLRELVIKQNQSTKGETVDEPQIKRVYSSSPLRVCRVAGENETPNVIPSKHVSLNLYEGVLKKEK